MKINWKVRLLSVKFWLALIPALLLVGQSVAAVFGYNWDFASLGKELTGVVNAIFAVLAILGVVTDPTTSGIGDSDLVMNRLSQLPVGQQSVRVPNPNYQGKQIAETPQLQPISTDDTSNVPHETQSNKPVETIAVSHETTPESGANGNDNVQH